MINFGGKSSMFISKLTVVKAEQRGLNESGKVDCNISSRSINY